MKAFGVGAGAALSTVLFLNARVLMFAAGYRLLPAELRDGGAARASIEHVLSTEADLY